MTIEKFNEGIDLLVGGKRPYKWTDDSKGAYWAALHTFDGDEFYGACKRLNITADAMPTVGQIAREIKPQKGVNLSACIMCDKGQVRYVYVSPDGLRYDRFGACTCQAGDKVAMQIVQMQRLRADANGIALKPDQLSPDTYTMPAIRQRYGDAIMPEKWEEKKHVAEIEVPPKASLRRRKQIEGLKATMLRLIEKNAQGTTEDINEQLRVA